MRFGLALLMIAACKSGSAAPPAHDAGPAARANPDDPWSVPDQPHRERALTQREIDAVRPIFGDGVDYASVRIVDDHFGPIQPDGVMMTPQGKIFAPGDAWEDDFFAPQEQPVWIPSLIQSGLVHELVHVWQYENGADLLSEGAESFARNEGRYGDTYMYQLDPGKDLLDYGFEQQAAIVEDWFLMKYWQADSSGTPLPSIVTAQALPKYEATLKKFFADPLYARARRAP